MNLYNKKLSFILLVTVLNLILSGAILLGPTTAAQETLGLFPTGNTQVELQFTWLNVANFQKIDNNAQNAVVAATRDSVVFALHSMNRHTEDECVRNMESEEVEVVKNSMLIIGRNDPKYDKSVVHELAQLLAQLCSFSPPNPTPDPLPNPSL